MGQVRNITMILERVAATVVKRLTLNITANLTEDTPKDTGWAAANWVPNVGAPKGLGDTPDSRSERQARVVGATNSQQAAGALIAASYRLNQGSVFIANSVPYIVDLNEGSSLKAPSGFVQAAIQRGFDQTLRGIKT